MKLWDPHSRRWFLMFLLLFSLPEISDGKEREPAAGVDTTAEEGGISEEWSVAQEFWTQTRSSLTTVIAWPFERLIQPVFGLVLKPLEPPLEYFFDEDVPQRALDLASFGTEKNIVIYPFFALASGTGTTYGAAYRQESPSSPRRYSLGLSAEQTFDLDRAVRAEGSFLLPGNFSRLSGTLSQKNIRAKTFYMPQGGPSLLHSDSTQFIELGMEFFGGQGWAFSVTREFYDNLYRTAPEVIATSIDPGEDPNRFRERVDEMRRGGLYTDYREMIWSFALGHNVLESRFAATQGYRWQLKGEWGEPEGFSPFLRMSGKWEIARLLGNRVYELTREEHREKQRYLRKFSIDDAIDLIRPDQFQKIYLERKVLVNYLTWSRIYSLDGGPVPVMALPGLGKGSPLRAYDYRRFTDRAALLWSLEYRWPLLMKVDGVFFNEYGYTYPGEERFADGSLHNSWGFGIRARNPNFYFFRMQFAFHGSQGVSMLITIRPEFR